MGRKTNDTKVVVFTNNKGGVGKTSSCTTIGATLSLLGYKVLIVDNDFQSNTTATFLTDGEQPEKTICDIYRMTAFKKETVSECIMDTAYKNLDLLPASPELKDMDVYLYSQIGKRIVQKILAKALKVVKEDYDYVLIDTHPDANMVAQNALCCSDYVLTPAQASGYSVQGLVPLVNDIVAIASDEDLNPNLKFLGMFLVNVNTRTGNFKQYKDFCQETFKDDYIQVSVRNDIALEAVSTWLMPLPYLLGSKDYRSSSRWKAIYDYIEFMHDVEMIDDADYVIGMAAFYTLEGRLQVSCKDGDIMEVRQTVVQGQDSSEPSEYENTAAFSLVQIESTINESEELRSEVKNLLTEVAHEDRMLRSYDGTDGRRKYVKISNLTTKDANEEEK